jgi:hypothetical protein
MAEADRAAKGEAPPGPAPPAAATKGGGLKGALIALAVFAALVAAAWYVYQQQTTASAQRETIVREAESLNHRALDARRRLGRVAPGIDSMVPGPQHDEVLRLRESVLRNLDAVGPLVQPGLVKPETVVRARELCDRIDGDLARIETLVASVPPTGGTPS